MVLSVINFNNIILLSVSEGLPLYALFRLVLSSSYLMQYDMINYPRLEQSGVSASPVNVDPAFGLVLSRSQFFQNLSHKPVVWLINALQSRVISF